MFGLTEKEIALMRTVFTRQNDVNEVKIYGSRATGSQQPNSDIDFAVWGKINHRLIGKISRDLDELPLPYTFDVTDYASVDHAPLKQHIDEFGKIFFSKEDIQNPAAKPI
jgi:predicted nucleotidyltransferase